MSAAVLPDIASPETFGPALENAVPVVDPETDFDADSWNLARVQLAAMSYTLPRAIVTCTVAGAAITLAYHAAVWGNSSGVAPTVTYNGTGDYTIEWEASYDDFQETPEAHSVNIRHAVVSGHYSLGGMTFERSIVSATRVDVSSNALATGNLTDCNSFTLVVW